MCVHRKTIHVLVGKCVFFYVVAQAFGKRYKSFQSTHMHGRCGYGSIPINTIFRGMNIHLPAILMLLLVLTHCHVCTCSWHRGSLLPGGAASSKPPKVPRKTWRRRHSPGDSKWSWRPWTRPPSSWYLGTMVTMGDQIVTPTPPWLGQFWLQFGWNMRWINGCLGRWNRPHHLSGQVSPKDLVAGKIKSLAFSAPTRCRWIGSGAGVICRLNFLKWNELIRSNSNWLGPMMVGTRGCSFHFLTLHRTILGCCGWSQDWWSDPCGSHHGRDASLSWVGVNTDGP